MEYNYPHKGYQKIIDQFMLGEKYFVAPVLAKGEVEREVVFPNGKWKDMTDGTVYGEGTHCEHTLKADENGEGVFGNIVKDFIKKNDSFFVSVGH